MVASEESKLNIRPIYWDDYILVVDKPAGLVVNRAESVKTKTLQDWLEEEGWVKPGEGNEVFAQRSGLAHRLDKDTSGVLLIGRTPSALEFLLAEFKERRVKKKYLALVHGSVPEEGVIDAPIQRNPFNRRRFTVFIGGRPSKTKYRLKESFSYQGKWYSLVEVFPQTGRTHQVRVHFRYLGHPLVGDSFYSGRKKFQTTSDLTPRIFLHAVSLTFRHPSSKKEVTFTSPLPPDLKAVLKRLSGNRN